ncbi:unnamed protein product [Albugo candida]|uniref:Uncharacterized protein n=1 Tax=Albugo candida TaxID=65357 RepID=A0A024G4G1_9STRA|nr:unnamed protein product [Albugo candida]|eukprot:CCI41407.1 unnamed protein product [Albugo candida]
MRLMKLFTSVSGRRRSLDSEFESSSATSRLPSIAQSFKNTIRLIHLCQNGELAAQKIIKCERNIRGTDFDACSKEQSSLRSRCPLKVLQNRGRQKYLYFLTACMFKEVALRAWLYLPRSEMVQTLMQN